MTATPARPQGPSAGVRQQVRERMLANLRASLPPTVTDAQFAVLVACVDQAGEELRRATAQQGPVCDCFPHGPDEPCTCDGCWACAGRVVGCTCDIAWDCEHDRHAAQAHDPEASDPVPDWDAVNALLLSEGGRAAATGQPLPSWVLRVHETMYGRSS